MLFYVIAMTLSAFIAAQGIPGCKKFVLGLPVGVGPFCQECNEGFLNTGTECIPCSDTNCKVCQPPDAQLCTQCKHPYTLVDGKCQFLICADVAPAGPLLPPAFPFPCGPDCVSCPFNERPFCSKCKEGFWNDNGYCKPCCVNDCKVCQPPAGFVCTQCSFDNLPSFKDINDVEICPTTATQRNSG